MKPYELRELIRNEEFVKSTTGACNDFAQANLVILPKEYAFDFLLYTQRNHKACPVIDVLEAGQIESRLAKGSDIRTDIPLYYIYEDGQFVEEMTDITRIWQDDFVSFLLGCSFTFESALIKEGIPLRHIDENKNVAMYRTNIATEPAGQFSGPLVVSMRPVKNNQVERAKAITSRFPNMHGAPVHVGDPAVIGIEDISSPDYGEFVEVKEDETPVFWACGVTPQAAAVNTKIPRIITHAPGHMFVTDKKNEDFQ
ncbi:putative hydro-lyase [Desertibacillus haloalkaliphilus]|uniref:putative hydro-lyase n=1 Tax=Desertibacillus haloalkaliphilus TaxID=1328930 RepID=UPI001C271F71|nr:putative hydro-lyase [Desertibacillus haloalkaliphilus]MBU8907518.1 putative hydro-lyase [Desertibacillus haloalkaliphilus]